MRFAVRNILRPVAAVLCIVLLNTQVAQATPTTDNSSVSAGSQTPNATPAATPPLPAALRTAKKVFVQNDALSIDMYNGFVAALSAWGYYTLVDSPEKADIIFDFRDAPLGVTMQQPSSGVILWTVSDPLNGAYPVSRKKRASLEIENIVSALKEVAGVPLTAEDQAALTPVGFRHNGGFVVLISVLGALTVVAVLVLVLHSRAKEKPVP